MIGTGLYVGVMNMSGDALEEVTAHHCGLTKSHCITHFKMLHFPFSKHLKK